MIIIFLAVISISAFIFILYKKFGKHYWFNVSKKMNEDKYFSDPSFNNGSIIETNLNFINLNQLEELYKNYFSSFKITPEKIRNFFKNMENPAIIYKESDRIIASVLNSINSISYKNIKYKVNFVDYAIVDKNIRNKNVFQGLMNQVANYTNKNNTQLIMFKIDVNPIPSFPDYNFVSKYYVAYKSKYPIGKSKIELKNIKPNYYKKINEFLKNNFIFYPIINSNLGNILINNEERITIIIEEKIIINLKYNSNDYLELLYVICLEEDNVLLEEGINYIFNNLNFKYLLVDKIGYNCKIIKLFEERFKSKHKTYHYILGINEKLDKKNVYYYF